MEWSLGDVDDGCTTAVGASGALVAQSLSGSNEYNQDRRTSRRPCPSGLGLARIMLILPSLSRKHFFTSVTSSTPCSRSCWSRSLLVINSDRRFLN